MSEELKSMISNDERIKWEGKPNKKCFIFESIFNPMLPFAILWGVIDFSIIGFGFFGERTREMSHMLPFLIGFFAIHLMPVWIYLSGVLLARRRYKNTNYIVTDRAIYTSQGVFSKKVQSKPFAEMSHIDLNRGFFDQRFGVGDVICTSSHNNPNGTSSTIVISSISDYMEVFNMVKKLQQDIYTDIMYPNDKRPKENHGYNTEYIDNK